MKCAAKMAKIKGGAFCAVGSLANKGVEALRRTNNPLAPLAANKEIQAIKFMGIMHKIEAGKKGTILYP